MIFSIVRLLLQSKSQAKVVLICISEVESLSNLSLGKLLRQLNHLNLTGDNDRSSIYSGHYAKLY